MDAGLNEDQKLVLIIPYNHCIAIHFSDKFNSGVLHPVARVSLKCVRRKWNTSDKFNLNLHSIKYASY
jgi:hypothetical protein